MGARTMNPGGSPQVRSIGVKQSQHLRAATSTALDEDGVPGRGSEPKTKRGSFLPDAQSIQTRLSVNP